MVSARRDAARQRRVRVPQSLEKVTEEAKRVIRPGEDVDVTIRKRGPYRMLATDPMEDVFENQTEPMHVVVSLGFIARLPRYNLPSLSKDLFWTIVGLLAEKDEHGQYVHINRHGEIAVTQDQLARMLGVKRPTINVAIGHLMARNFLWKTRRGKYQLHPLLLYFGSATRQDEAIGYAKAHFEDKELPVVPEPGSVIAHEITPDGVTDIRA
ncbi:hypothetical protein ACFYXM_20390 [Streptomyces sp. NPDC002476]|uniref:hypothetical protein n=1 Tax=Streptomyces sp. NPDC002476 TaxID=3364648 RepID=UPI003689BE1F